MILKKEAFMIPFTWKGQSACIGVTGALACLVAWLFYRSIWGLLWGILLYLPVKKRMQRYWSHRQKSAVLFQFKEILQMAAASAKAGYSMENAFVQAREEFVKLYGEHSAMAREFANINRQVCLNVPLEQLLEELAERYGIEEMVSFAQVFRFAKRSGGDFLKIFHNTAGKIRQKAEVKREIETVMAAKRMEMNLMNAMPFAILLYVGVTSPEFLDPLYGNLLGSGIMTACLAGYGAAYWIAGKIVDIQV